MTRINLLPPERIKEKRGRAPAERSYLWLVIALPLLVLLLMGVWWFSMNGELNRKEEELQQANAELTDIQAKTAALKQYQDRQEEIKQIETTVVQALSGRVYWARILNNVAIMCPLNVWLTSLNGTTSGTEGTVTFEARATQCPNRLLGGFFPGMLDYHPDFRPVAGWLDRMAQIEQFQRVWLASAEPEFLGTMPEGAEASRVVSTATGAWVIRFSSTATLNMNTAAIGTPKSAAPAAAPAPSTTPEGEGEGGT